MTVNAVYWLGGCLFGVAGTLLAVWLSVPAWCLP